MTIAVTQNSEAFNLLDQELEAIFNELENHTKDESSSEAHDTYYAYHIINFMQYNLRAYPENVTQTEDIFTFPVIDMKLKANKHFTNIQDFNDLVINLPKVEKVINDVSKDFKFFVSFHCIPYTGSKSGDHTKVFAKLDTAMQKKSK